MYRWSSKKLLVLRFKSVGILLTNTYRSVCVNDFLEGPLSQQCHEVALCTVPCRVNYCTNNAKVVSSKGAREAGMSVVEQQYERCVWRGGGGWRSCWYWGLRCSGKNGCHNTSHHTQEIHSRYGIWTVNWSMVYCILKWFIYLLNSHLLVILWPDFHTDSKFSNNYHAGVEFLYNSAEHN